MSKTQSCMVCSCPVQNKFNGTPIKVVCHSISTGRVVIIGVGCGWWWWVAWAWEGLGNNKCHHHCSRNGSHGTVWKHMFPVAVTSMSTRRRELGRHKVCPEPSFPIFLPPPSLSPCPCPPVPRPVPDLSRPILQGNVSGWGSTHPPTPRQLQGTRHTRGNKSGRSRPTNWGYHATCLPPFACSLVLVFTCNAPQNQAWGGGKAALNKKGRHQHAWAHLFPA